MRSFSHQIFPRPAREIEVAPGTKVLPVDVRKIPAIGMFTWKRQVLTLQDGRRVVAYIPVEEVHDAYMRLSEVEKKLPLGMSSEVIKKLILAGFVEGAKVTPTDTKVNVRSLLEHFEACRADWQFWERDGRRQRYSDGIDMDDDLDGAD
jgi:hypothetical protein